MKDSTVLRSAAPICVEILPAVGHLPQLPSARLVEIDDLAVPADEFKIPFFVRTGALEVDIDSEESQGILRIGRVELLI